MQNERSQTKMLSEINQSLSEFKDLMKDEIHKLNLNFVEVRSDIKNIDDKMSNKIDAMGAQLARIETEQATHDHHIMLMKDDIHRHDLDISGVSSLPEEVSKLRHKLNNNEQRLIILEEKTKNVDLNTQMLNGQKAVFKFLQAKPVLAILAIAAAGIAASYGVGVNP